MNTTITQSGTTTGSIGQSNAQTRGVGQTQTTQTQSTQTQGTTGTGVIGSTGPVPDQSSPGYSNLIQQLRSFVPKGTMDDFEAMLAKVTSKIKDAVTDVQEGRANNEMETKRVSIKENEAKIEESKKKLDEAEAKKKSGNIFDILSLVFQAIGAALVTALGVLLSATPMGPLLIASGVLMFVGFINSLTAKANEGAGILGSMVKAAGGDQNAVMAADGAFAAALMIAAIVMIPVTAKMAPAMVGDIMAKVTQLAKTIGTAIQTVTATLDAAAQVGKAGLGMAAAVDKREATELRAESTEMQAMMQQLDDIIDMALSLLMQLSSNMNAMLDQLTDMMKDTGDTLSNTQFV